MAQNSNTGVSNVDEQLVQQITKQVINRLAQANGASQASPRNTSDKKLVPVNLSVRHIHLCREDCDALFGKGFDLEHRNPLYQPNEFASKQSLTLVGPRMRCLGEVRVLGPLRKFTQVEVSRTDAIYLGIDPPVRPSGNHEGTGGIILVGPAGVLHLQKGVILANRHVHISQTSADKWGIRDNEIRPVRVKTPHKNTLLEDCQMRVSDLFLDEMHLDTDDGNACGLRGGELVEIL